MQKVAVTCVAGMLLLCRAEGQTGLDSWQRFTVPEGMGSVVYGNGAFVAFGQGTSVVSTNGTSWFVPDFRGAAALGYGGGLFVSLFYDTPMVLTSVDGITWRENVIQVGGVFVDTRYNAIAYGRGRYVAVGLEGRLGLSTDGVHWTNWISRTNWAFMDVAFARGMFVAVGGAGMAGTNATFLSRDGIDWETVPIQSQEWVTSVTYGRGKFIVVLPDEGVFTSADGRAWHRVLEGLPSRFGWWHAAYGNGVFVCNGSSGTIYTSTDGETWQARRTGFDNAFGGAAFGGGRFVVATGDRVLLSGPMSAHVSAAAFRLGETLRLEDGAMLLTIEAPYGREVVVEASEDLAGWKEIARDPCDRGEFEVYDEAAKDLKHRYYRARQAAP